MSCSSGDGLGWDLFMDLPGISFLALRRLKIYTPLGATAHFFSPDTHQALQPPQATFNSRKLQVNGPGVSPVSPEQSFWTSRSQLDRPTKL